MVELEPLALPVEPAAALIGVKRTKLYELLKAGELPLVKIGGKSVVPLSALKAFIASKTDAAVTPKIAA
jgi:excisionase family DNA binding protein